MFLLLLLIWIIFNGKITLEIVLFGMAVSAAVLAFMCKFMDYSIKRELSLYRNFFWFVKYLCILIWEIIKANIAVIKLMITSRYELEPVIVSFKSPVKSKFAKVLLANSITLTPGTITVSQEEDNFVVHCLDSSLAPGLDSSIFVEQLKKMEEKNNGYHTSV